VKIKQKHQYISREGFAIR